MSDFPLASIVVVTWNSAPCLSSCLDALVNQSCKDFEVILVDNGSSDGSLDSVEERWPALTMRIERLGENKGFAAANNIGARLARGQWLALLNSDAFPEPDWLEKLLGAARDNPEFSSFASRQLQVRAGDLLDGAGDVFHVSGLAWRRYAGWPAAQYGLEPAEVFSPCGAAALYARQPFLEAGGFDEDFFSYHEDVDLGFRLRLQGFRCLYVPQAVVHHIGSVSTGIKSDFVIYHGHRNLVWTYVKNMPPALFWLYFPVYLLMNLFALLYFSIKGNGKAIWRAKWDGLRGLGRMLKKREEIQRQRRLPVTRLHRLMERNWLAPLIVKRQQQRFMGRR